MKQGFTRSLILACFALAWVAADAPAEGEHQGHASPGIAENVSPIAQSEGTRRMVERLAELARNADPFASPFESEARIERRKRMEPPIDPLERTDFDFQRANEFLSNGNIAEAVTAFQELWDRIRVAPQNQRFADEVQSMLAISWMRLGETENCVNRHGVDSCLLPIQGNGVHVEQRGSRAAIGIYTEILRARPNDLSARWLLNVAYMTVGEYPAKVPAEWLIPPGVFASDYDIKRFYDVGSPTGLDLRGLAGGAVMDDFDGDGLLDIFISSMGSMDQIHFFHNLGDGRFERRTEAAGLTGIVGGLNIVHADYDNDGDLDLFVLRGGWLREGGLIPNSLLRNNGNATFDDVTEEAGMLSFHPTQAGAWGDFDNDGWVDLFIANETTSTQSVHPCELYRNNHDGTFTEMSAAAGISAAGLCKGAVWGDYDNDGRLDLYVATIAEAPSNKLFHNEGPDATGQVRFRDVADEAGVREPARSFPTWFFDYDNDGWLDLFVSGYAATTGHVAADYLGMDTNAEKPRLYRNQHDGTFVDRSRELGVDDVLFTMGCNFGDLDNDGWLDFYAGTGNPDFRTLVPNRMFRNDGGRAFQDVTTSGGFGHLQKAHGVAFGDIDNDGDQDVYLKVGGAYKGDDFHSALYENPGHGNNWITVKLIGNKSNRAAIGARLKATIEEPAGVRDLHLTAGSGGSFGGSSMQQEIGLGTAQSMKRLEITWPVTGEVQVFENLESGQFLVIREGDEKLERVTLGTFDLSPLGVPQPVACCPAPPAVSGVPQAATAPAASGARTVPSSPSANDPGDADAPGESMNRAR